MPQSYGRPGVRQVSEMNDNGKMVVARRRAYLELEPLGIIVEFGELLEQFVELLV